MMRDGVMVSMEVSGVIITKWCGKNGGTVSVGVWHVGISLLAILRGPSWGHMVKGVSLSVHRRSGATAHRQANI